MQMARLFAYCSLRGTRAIRLPKMQRYGSKQFLSLLSILLWIFIRNKPRCVAKLE
jgi:hypothetical protein